MTSFQLLSCRVEIRHDDPALSRALAYLRVDAQQTAAVRKTFRYDISGAAPYAVYEEGDLLTTVAGPEGVLDVVYRRVNGRALERLILSGWVVFHAAVVEINGRRLLVLGHKGAGKTTLAARLLYAGHRVEGDELALERDGRVVAFPRPLHLKPGIERHVPELRDIVGELPAFTGAEARLAALDPARLGFAWRIAAAPMDETLWISPRHGGVTSIESRGPFETIRRVVEGARGCGESRQAVVAAAARLGRAGGREVLLGDAAEAVRLLEATFAAADS